MTDADLERFRVAMDELAARVVFAYAAPDDDEQRAADVEVLRWRDRLERIFISATRSGPTDTS
jgi:hypothetical protein